jgi:hypothetical protein
MNPILILAGIGIVLYLSQSQDTATATSALVSSGASIDQGGVAVPSDVIGSEPTVYSGTGAAPPTETGDYWYDFEQMTQWKTENPDWIFDYPELMAD